MPAWGQRKGCACDPSAEKKVGSLAVISDHLGAGEGEEEVEVVVVAGKVTTGGASNDVT